MKQQHTDRWLFPACRVLALLHVASRVVYTVNELQSVNPAFFQPTEMKTLRGWVECGVRDADRAHTLLFVAPVSASLGVWVDPRASPPRPGVWLELASRGEGRGVAPYPRSLVAVPAVTQPPAHWGRARAQGHCHCHDAQGHQDMPHNLPPHTQLPQQRACSRDLWSSQRAPTRRWETKQVGIARKTTMTPVVRVDPLPQQSRVGHPSPALS